MTVRAWHMGEAVHSIRRLRSVLHELTLEEVLAALKIERETSRRGSVVQTLEQQAKKLNREAFAKTLSSN